MKNLKIPLPKKLWSIDGTQPKIDFEFSRRHYWINDEQYDHSIPAKDFAFFKYSILNEIVLVTVFSDLDIIRD